MCAIGTLKLNKLMDYFSHLIALGQTNFCISWKHMHSFKMLLNL